MTHSKWMHEEFHEASTIQNASQILGPFHSTKYTPLHIPDPLSTTSAAISSSSDILQVVSFVVVNALRTGQWERCKSLSFETCRVDGQDLSSLLIFGPRRRATKMAKLSYVSYCQPTKMTLVIVEVTNEIMTLSTHDLKMTMIHESTNGRRFRRGSNGTVLDFSRCIDFWLLKRMDPRHDSFYGLLQ